MATVRETEVGDILQDLVNQFSDPMAFFRELIQNSIDAGSLEVDIRVEYQASESDPDKGTIIAHIDDFGEGMTREIIETKLTRLFSSTKDDDFTKIGRFGIGFVSVFAVEPDAVILDTARGGEAWRVIFHPDRTYDLIRLDIPVEGTQIKVIKTSERQGYEDFKHRAVEVIQKWCKHVQVPIYFDGEDIRYPFDVESICKVRYEEEGTRIVAGYTTLTNAPYGFYNRGLTLKEGGSSAWRLMTFKIDSRYLEHTLTRDQVLEDRHYHKAAELLDRVAEEMLPARLFELLEEHAGRSGERYDALVYILQKFGLYFPQQVRSNARRPIIRTRSGPISLKDALVAADDGRLFASRGTHLVQQVPEFDGSIVIIDMHHSSQFDELIEQFSNDHLRLLEDHWVLPERQDASIYPGAAALVREVDSLLASSFDHRVKAISFGKFDYPGSPIAESIAWLVDRYEPQRVSELRRLDVKSLESSDVIVLNLHHSSVVDLLRVAQKEPEWAAYQMLKLLVVANGLSVPAEDQIVRSALERRELRRSRV